jgi:hypothetical protein
MAQLAAVHSAPRVCERVGAVGHGGTCSEGRRDQGRLGQFLFVSPAFIVLFEWMSMQ